VHKPIKVGACLRFWLAAKCRKASDKFAYKLRAFLLLFFGIAKRMVHTVKSLSMPWKYNAASNVPFVSDALCKFMRGWTAKVR
jgi:hypothetical protein